MVGSVIKGYLFKKQFGRIWIKDRPKKGKKNSLQRGRIKVVTVHLGSNENAFFSFLQKC
jgi:hypothetical protein